MTATPFSKVLVANRGEIALRVMRSAQALGLRTVAVYSTADAQSRHVREADQAVCIGEALPSQSYLNIAAILDAARRTGADAVHPGYGFLAENHVFAQACVDAGLVFIGPSAQAILHMGNKAGAKQSMMAAGVPCIPGYQGEDQSAERLKREADALGYPVMIKATAGGGGRGMRLVHSPAAFEELLQSAQSEAHNAFGDASVLLEKAVKEPRHIEIQILADRHGHAIHLGERDCSVQRRHQKLIEEAPSPAVDQALRERMGAVALAAVKAMGYEGAGTLEFLLDAQGQFFFMEMNTRLQVEHPVTEAITGLDLVALQLRIAAGEPLALQQEDVKWQGHAIEVRLCAEDPQQGFMPQSGRLAHWSVPPHLRVEHGLASGADIPPYYDAMMAKFISHGESREEARRKLLHGLQDAVVLGVTSNQAFLASCLAHPVFAAGQATTAFIEQHSADLLHTAPDVQQQALALAAVLMVETAEGVNWRADQRRLQRQLPMQLRLHLNGHTHSLNLQHQAGRAYGVDGLSIDIVDMTAQDVRYACNGVQASATWVRDGDQLWLQVLGQAWGITDLTRAASQRLGAASSDGKLRASMNGRVVAVMVAVGDRVKQGQTLLTLEAMKMEHLHLAPASGRVRTLSVAVGDQVPASRVVLEIEMDKEEVAS